MSHDHGSFGLKNDVKLHVELIIYVERCARWCFVLLEMSESLCNDVYWTRIFISTGSEGDE
jgi:hypothetical protein